MAATDLQGRTFLVTGANSGIGRATAEALAARGRGVVLGARSEERTRLTNLLLPKLRESPQGRIVNVASAGHMTVKRMDCSGLERRTAPKRSGFHDYAVTKLMNVLHAKELARRLAGSRVTTYGYRIPPTIDDPAILDEITADLAAIGYPRRPGARGAGTDRG
jgi:NAD(P)-dependent dehydrogenase (short-subunit alcohol dehydrogenase family)